MRSFKTLLLALKGTAGFCRCEVVFGSTRGESFSLAGNKACSISNGVRGAHGSSDQRGLRNGADVQIGGGVRVGDAFQAFVGLSFIAI